MDSLPGKGGPLLKFYLFVSQDNPYLALQMDEEVHPSSGYYLQPVDDVGVREFKLYVKSPPQSPTSETEEPSQFGDLEGGRYRYVICDILNSRTCSYLHSWHTSRDHDLFLPMMTRIQFVLAF